MDYCCWRPRAYAPGSSLSMRRLSGPVTRRTVLALQPLPPLLRQMVGLNWQLDTAIIPRNPLWEKPLDGLEAQRRHGTGKQELLMNAPSVRRLVLLWHA